MTGFERCSEGIRGFYIRMLVFVLGFSCKPQRGFHAVSVVFPVRVLVRLVVLTVALIAELNRIETEGKYWHNMA